MLANAKGLVYFVNARTLQNSIWKLWGVPKSGQSGTVTPSVTEVYMFIVCVFLEWGRGAGLCRADYHFLEGNEFTYLLEKKGRERLRGGGGGETCVNSREHQEVPALQKFNLFLCSFLVSQPD